MDLCTKLHHISTLKKKVDDDGVTSMEKFSGTTADTILKNHHKWDCQVYVLDARIKGTIGGLPKWETNSHAGI